MTIRWLLSVSNLTRSITKNILLILLASCASSLLWMTALSIYWRLVMLIRKTTASSCSLNLVFSGNTAIFMMLEVLLSTPHCGGHVHVSNIASVIRSLCHLICLVPWIRICGIIDIPWRPHNHLAPIPMLIDISYNTHFLPRMLLPCSLCLALSTHPCHLLLLPLKVVFGPSRSARRWNIFLLQISLVCQELRCLVIRVSRSLRMRKYVGHALIVLGAV